MSREILYDFERVKEKVKEYKKADKFIEKAYILHKENKNRPFQFDEKGEFVKNKLYRPFIQEVGKIARETFGPSIWVDLFLENVKKYGKGKIIICDDVRSIYEYETFLKMRAMLIRLDVEQEEQIKRIKALYGTFDKNSLYEETETALDDKFFEYRYDTTNISIEELGSKIVEDYEFDAKTRNYF